MLDANGPLTRRTLLSGMALATLPVARAMASGTSSDQPKFARPAISSMKNWRILRDR